MEESILEKNDEVLLLDKGFKFGLSGTTLWREDKNGKGWCAVLDRPGEAIIWYAVRPSGGLGESVTMSREVFGELFNHDKP
jgi:hypothetical protein